MILQVDQVSANGNNQFEIRENGMLLYRAHTPFYKPVIPVGGSAFRQLSLTAPDGSLIVSTAYDMAENLRASAIPLSWIFTGSKQVDRYSVQNGAGQTAARFYFEQTGAMNTRLVIEAGGRVTAGYIREVGKREVVSFYEGERQVGQLTKPNCVTNQLDRYLLHFFDGVIAKEIAAFFVVYYDYLYHHNSGKIGVGRDIHVTYTYDKNSKKYHKDLFCSLLAKKKTPV